MSEQFMLLPVVLLKQQMVTEIRKCNDYTEKYGLQLTDDDIHVLAEVRKEALERSGRIEFGGGVIQKLIVEFADSPYITQDNYVETLTELQECFYYFKNEMQDELSDDELIHLMKRYFDRECQGSLEYLRSTILENCSRNIRYQTDEYDKYNGYDDDYDEFQDYDRDEYDEF